MLTGARGPALAEIDITTPRRHGIEDHSWLFQDMPSRDASVNPATHRVSVGSRSDLSPFARLSLAFRPTSHTTATCANSDFAGTKYVGQVTGTVRLVTGLDGVTFSRAHVSFGRSSSLEVTRPALPRDAMHLRRWATREPGQTECHSPRHSDRPTGT